ncbi:Pyridinium-3,5-bisthiocarboxylic acid mononucleotide synthase [Methanosarcinaceae archaeon Ag5]|uniref:Pyridinium-3,5-bisthiocarboxylic acid mononucleotide synthase n=1 Tax=Methanolapillus africanus TaxID=3028297 RepID=A0AAE4SEZ8_9EURY|nr:Pyridinium-3,5-bisthiocarboxylic acid mononucleotide synthase [Methanosarcinaceae archaeon Ag5]
MAVSEIFRTEKKEQELKDFFARRKNVLVAFSGGVDSSLLAAVAAETPGLKVLAVTVSSPLVPERELENARKIAADIGVSHILLEKRMLDMKGIRKNELNRCFVCKKEIMESLIQIAKDQGFEAVVDGTNYSDVMGTVSRPGYNAILEINNNSDFKIQMPYVELQITKDDIRKMSKKRKVLSSDKPSMSCLATRFTYDTVLTPELLKTIDTAEEMMVKCGFSQIRIRCHIDSERRKFARIEINNSEMEKLFDSTPCNGSGVSGVSGISSGSVGSSGSNGLKIQSVIDFLKKSGFSYVTLDLEGFRSGSMDL